MSTAVEQQNAVALNDNDDSLPKLEIREMQEGDAHMVKEFCLNNLMQRARLSNQFVYSSPVWLSIFISALAWATNTVQPWKRHEWGRWAFLCCAIASLALVGVDYFTYFHYEKKTKLAHEQDQFVNSPVKFLAQKTGKAWIAMYGDGLVGCVVLQPAGPKAKEAEITNWYVRTRYREKGLGGDLLKEALSAARRTKVSKVTLQTSSINKRANQSLKKIGFAKIESKADPNVYWRMLRISNMTWSINPQTIDEAVLKPE